MLRVERNNAFLRASSEGKTLRLLFSLRYWLLRLSMMLVVYKTFLTACEYLKMGQTQLQGKRFFVLVSRVF